MLLRRYQPTIHKLPDPIRPVHRVPLSDTCSCPASPLERNPQTPKGWKNRESDGIGLGIVAALERSDGLNHHRPEPTKHVSAPMSICNNSRNLRDELGCNWRSCGGENRAQKYTGGWFFCGSPPATVADDLRRFRTADFLNYCYLCRRKLHGKDIYMYRGEKAFCSMECRYQQIVSDEVYEKCGSEALRPSDASSSSYANHPIFFAGIAAA